MQMYVPSSVQSKLVRLELKILTFLAQTFKLFSWLSLGSLSAYSQLSFSLLSLPQHTASDRWGLRYSVLLIQDWMFLLRLETFILKLVEYL